MPHYLKILRWLTAVSIIVLLALPVCLCVNIYTHNSIMVNQSAAAIFTRENVAEGLRPFWAALAVNAVLVAGVFIVQSRIDINEITAAMTPANRLRLVKARVYEIPSEARKEEKRRRYVTAVAVVIALGCIAPGMVYMLRGENFVSWDMEKVMGGVVMTVLPGVIAALCIMCVNSYLRDKSMIREIAILKNSPLSEKKVSDVKNPLPLTAVRIALYAVAAVLIAWGIRNGGLRDVLVKAINICTECIGLG